MTRTDLRQSVPYLRRNIGSGARHAKRAPPREGSCLRERRPSALRLRSAYCGKLTVVVAPAMTVAFAGAENASVAALGLVVSLAAQVTASV